MSASAGPFRFFGVYASSCIKKYSIEGGDYILAFWE